MPLTGFKPTCSYCDANKSVIWRKDGSGDCICHKCFVNKKSRSEESNAIGNRAKANGIKSCKSNARNKSVRNKVFPKGKSRRSAFKAKHVAKTESSGSTITTSDFIIHQGQYFQRGDVVSVIDADDHRTYYAQCNAFMTNEFCEKFLSITWLLPIKKLEPNCSFQPSLFYLGPSDELIRNMNCVEFVCHAPTDYFKPENSIFSTIPNALEKGYVTVNMS